MAANRVCGKDHVCDLRRPDYYSKKMLFVNSYFEKTGQNK